MFPVSRPLIAACEHRHRRDSSYCVNLAAFQRILSRSPLSGRMIPPPPRWSRIFGRCHERGFAPLVRHLVTPFRRGYK